MSERGAHYHGPAGFQAWDVTRYMSGNMAQAWQYVFRCDRKGTPIEDLRKAIDFIEDWLAHDDIPPSTLPAHAEASYTSAMCDPETVDSWKIGILFEILTAETYVGPAVNGQPFDGRKLMRTRTIPQIRAEIARRSVVTGQEGKSHG